MDDRSQDRATAAAQCTAKATKHQATAQAINAYTGSFITNTLREH